MLLFVCLSVYTPSNCYCLYVFPCTLQLTVIVCMSIRVRSTMLLLFVGLSVYTPTKCYCLYIFPCTLHQAAIVFYVYPCTLQLNVIVCMSIRVHSTKLLLFVCLSVYTPTNCYCLYVYRCKLHHAAIVCMSIRVHSN